MRDGFKVVGIDAGFDVAEVVDNKALWYLPVVFFVVINVRGLFADCAVTITADVSLPDPTWRRKPSTLLLVIVGGLFRAVMVLVVIMNVPVWLAFYSTSVVVSSSGYLGLLATSTMAITVRYLACAYLYIHDAIVLQRIYIVKRK